MTEELESLQDALRRLKAELGKVIIGQEVPIRDALIVLLTGQHALIEGVPGLAKTLLVRTLAQALLGCPFARIQFTPDLMPADITGTNVFNLQRGEFTLGARSGVYQLPAGGRNESRTSKTQSALLKRCRSVPFQSIARRTRCLRISPCSQRKTQSNSKARMPCPKRKRIGLCWHRYDVAGTR